MGSGGDMGSWGEQRARAFGPDDLRAPEVPGAAADPEEAARHRQDVEWVRRVRGGDVEAFGDLVDAYAGRLHGLLRRFLRDDDDVADVAQEALVRAFRSLDRYDATRPFYPWLRRIAVNLALNELAKRKVRRPVDEPEEVLLQLPDGTAADAPVEQRELTEAVEAALQAIPIEFAAVFRLRVHEDMSYAEIAEALDIPIGSVMSRLSRARARLAQALAARFGPRPEALP
jgi:RNA polymerase sigma-70 factor (ECF subfamily)